MNNKVINIISILCLIAVVSIMSWRDMHPKIEADASSAAAGVMGYYAGPDITPAMMPDDSKPVTISQEIFEYGPDGSTSWKHEGMLPTTFAQRQVNLQFDLTSLPKNPADTIKVIKSDVDDWVHKGDTINVLILDYSYEKADLKAYAAFLKAAHDAFKKNYVIYAGVNILWAEGPQKDALKDLRDSSPQFLIHIHLPQTQISPALLSRLEAFKYNFILQFPEGVQAKDIDAATLKKLGSLTGVILTLDPDKPLPVKEEKIGLFPKL